MNGHALKYDALLLLAAVIWGLGFVAQRAGMEHVEPFVFNGIRFFLGCLVLVPFIRFRPQGGGSGRSGPSRNERAILLRGGILAGLILFAAVSFQQVGITATTAGNAGFITGLYVVIVPFLGLFIGQRPGPGTWAGALLAATGLYLLSAADTASISRGDLLVLAGAFLWAIHVLVIGRYSPRTDPLKLAFLQFAVCSLLSTVTSVILEATTWDGICAAAVPILYGGICSVGIAYTLQVVAQAKAHPAHAAILLSLEAVFAAAGGWIILNESLSSRGVAGCALMLAAMLLSQLWGKRFDI
jgi:drug/metabolite transporter (DMT)-like permease